MFFYLAVSPMHIAQFTTNIETMWAKDQLQLKPGYGRQDIIVQTECGFEDIGMLLMFRDIWLIDTHIPIFDGLKVAEDHRPLCVRIDIIAETIAQTITENIGIVPGSNAHADK